MIAVVVPVFNGAEVLGRTVPAVAGLTGVTDTVWVDDGSTDSTLSVIAKYTSSSSRVLALSNNRGRATARNVGAAATRGEVVVFFDADVEPSAVAARALASAALEPGAVAAVARLQPVPDDPSDPYQEYAAHHPRGPAPDHTGPLDWRFFLAGACAVRRDAFDQAGGFPESVAYGEDIALAERLCAIAPEGLRLADTTVRLYDLGDLDRAVRHAEAFGEGLAHRQASVPLARWAGRVPGAHLAAPLLRWAATHLPAGSTRRRAVRYLLGVSALRAARRARTRPPS